MCFELVQEHQGPGEEVPRPSPSSRGGGRGGLISDEFATRFFRTSRLVANAVYDNIGKVASNVRSTMERILTSDQGRPKTWPSSFLSFRRKEALLCPSKLIARSNLFCSFKYKSAFGLLWIWKWPSCALNWKVSPPDHCNLWTFWSISDSCGRQKALQNDFVTVFVVLNFVLLYSWWRWVVPMILELRMKRLLWIYGLFLYTWIRFRACLCWPWTSILACVDNCKWIGKRQASILSFLSNFRIICFYDPSIE